MSPRHQTSSTPPDSSASLSTASSASRFECTSETIAMGIAHPSSTGARAISAHAYTQRMDVGELGEFALIERLRHALREQAPAELIVGIGDDAAVWRLGDRYTVAKIGRASCRERGEISEVEG